MSRFTQTCLWRLALLMLFAQAIAAHPRRARDLLSFIEQPTRFYLGQPQTITYSAPDLSQPVTFTLHKGGLNSHKTIITIGTAIGGSIVWTPSTTLEPGPDYAIEIRQGHLTSLAGPLDVTSGSPDRDGGSTQIPLARSPEPAVGIARARVMERRFASPLFGVPLRPYLVHVDPSPAHTGPVADPSLPGTGPAVTPFPQSNPFGNPQPDLLGNPGARSRPRGDDAPGPDGEPADDDPSVPRPVVTTVPRPVVTPVPRPVVTSVPRPVVTSVPRPVVTSVPRPVVTSIPRPVVTSVPRPVVNSAPRPDQGSVATTATHSSSSVSSSTSSDAAGGRRGGVVEGWLIGAASFLLWML